MKYYEFNKHEYYGLICAKDVKEAQKLYVDTIADLNKDDDAPTEITPLMAISKLINSFDKNGYAAYSNECIFEEFMKNIEKGEAFAILMDGALM